MPPLDQTPSTASSALAPSATPSTQALMGQLGANAKKEETAADSANADVKAIAKTTDGLQPPKLELPPKPEPKYRSPVEAFGSFAGLLATIGGSLTRRPLLNSLKAATGVMEAYKAQDEKAAQQQFETWKVETENAIKLADFQEKAYHDILEKAGIDEQTRLAMFTTTARALGDENSALIAEQHGLDEAKRLTMEQARLNQELKLNAPKVEEAHLQVMALKDVTQSDEFKTAKPAEKMAMIRDTVSPESWDQMKVSAAKSLEKQLVAKGMPQAEAETQAMAQVEKATTGAAANAKPFDKPVEIEFKGKDGKTQQVLAQQDAKTGQWVSADENRTPIQGDNVRIVKNDATGGGRSQVMIQRQLVDAKDAASEIANISELPISASTGWFGGREQGPSLFDATKEVLATKVSSQEVQDYNTSAVGLGRALAGLETGGLQANEWLMKQFDKLQLAEGDTQLTKLRKLATMRQNADNALDAALTNPIMGEKERDLAKTIKEQLEKSVPFTPHDVTALEQSQDPKVTIVMIAKKAGLGAEKPIKVKSQADYEGIASGGSYIAPDGKTYTKQ